MPGTYWARTILPHKSFFHANSLTSNSHPKLNLQCYAHMDMSIADTVRARLGHGHVTGLVDSARGVKEYRDHIKDGLQSQIVK